MEITIDSEFDFLGNIDFLEIIPGKITVHGWVWDRRMALGKSAGLIIVGRQVLGIIQGSNIREDIAQLGIGTNRGGFIKSFEFPGIENLDFTAIQLISLDGEHRSQQEEIRIINHTQEEVDSVYPVVGITKALEEKIFPAFQIIHNQENSPNLLQIRSFLPLNMREIPRVRISLNQGEFICWVVAKEVWSHSEANFSQNTRSAIIYLPPALLNGSDHRIRIDLVEGKKLFHGLVANIFLPDLDPMHIQLLKQKNLTKEYFSELSIAETQVLNLKFKVEDLESEYRLEKENFEKIYAESLKRATDLQSKLEKTKIKLKDAQNKLSKKEAALEERQRTLDALISQKSAMEKSNEALSRILKEI